ncbi:carnosine N-methyltransferase [Culicoides brevitarsis]|uniref:carnosine N-methyltransferase n=1 Tax=Culicoides brevitarsis TaxID=469753 RepID=UPI00307B25E4
MSSVTEPFADNHHDGVAADQLVDEERKNFLLILAAFRLYKTTSMISVDQREMYMNSLSKNHQYLLSKYRESLHKIRDAILTNYQVINVMVKTIDQLFLNDNESTYRDNNGEFGVKVGQNEIERVQVTLKQIARDWSADGEMERQQCYQPIIDEVTRLFPPNDTDVENVRILVPGAGLGRLMYELSYIGYFCEGNEFSLFMLIASNFILNRCLIENEYKLYPYVHQYVNNLNRGDQTRAITFPDVSPTQRPPKKGTMNMVAGDFLEIYKEADYWDCVATCFFIDCANNIVDFIETIYNILKPNGVWVNLGPLLYHYSDVMGEHSIEPTFEDICHIMKQVGFVIEKCATGVRTLYSQNPKSMHKSEYESVFFTCRKSAQKSECNGNSNKQMNGHTK